MQIVHRAPLSGGRNPPAGAKRAAGRILIGCPKSGRANGPAIPAASHPHRLPANPSTERACRPCVVTFWPSSVILLAVSTTFSTAPARLARRNRNRAFADLGESMADRYRSGLIPRDSETRRRGTRGLRGHAKRPFSASRH